MIINDLKKDVQTVGSFPTTTFKIAASAKAFQILSSNIYTHKVRAVIREICCNAHDAHIAANNPNKFDIHLPTYLEPWFAVRDYGTGLSEENMREVYTTYFTSTKTESNEFTGALGLGSKSPFCLVDSFLVTSWFDGEKKVFSCYKDSNGEPQIALLASEVSDEPRGLEVHVPNMDDRRSAFEDDAVNVLQWFEDAPGFNVNVPDVQERIKKLKKLLVITGPDFGFSSNYGSPKAVMGNVAYEIPYDIRATLSVAGYIKFNIGDLSFDPGRENLSLDDSTTAILQAKMAEIIAKVGEACLEKVEREPTPFKRSLVRESLMCGSLGTALAGATEEGVQKLMTYRMPSLSSVAKVLFPSRKNGVKTEWRFSLDFANNLKDVFICIDKPRMDRRLRNYVKVTGKTVYALTQKQADDLKIDPEFLSDIDSIPKVGGNNLRKSNGKGNNSVEIWHRMSGSIIKTDMIVDGEKVFLPVIRNKFDSNFHYSIGDWNRLLQKLEHVGVSVPDFYVVKKAYAQSSRFRKQEANGDWIHFDDFVRDQLLQILDNRSVQHESEDDSIQIFKTISAFNREFFKSEMPEGLEIFDKIAMAHDDNQKLMLVGELLADLSVQIDRGYEMIDLELEIFDKYPMLRLVSLSNMTEPMMPILANYLADTVVSKA